MMGVVMMHDAADSHPSGRAAADRSEPRAARTREAVLSVLHDHLAQGGPDLSVAELCRRAGIHRVTFYGHWSDIASATADAFAESVDRLAAVPDDVLDAVSSATELASAYRSALAHQLAEILHHRDTYCRLFTDAAFERRLIASLDHRAAAAIVELRRLGVKVPGHVDTAAAFIAGGVIAAFRVWAMSDGADIEDAADEVYAHLPPWWPRP